MLQLVVFGIFHTNIYTGCADIGPGVWIITPVSGYWSGYADFSQGGGLLGQVSVYWLHIVQILAQVS